MNASDFASFFDALYGKPPFRWQVRLAAQVAEQGWPGVVKLPTGAGKTALIDIAVFFLALDPGRAARRIFFVVDRRLVVDEAYRRAKQIENGLQAANNGILAEVAARLRGLTDETNASPLLVRRLRGGLPKERSFIDNPLQPAVVLTTVDQVGSRLLFRGYGVSEFMRPIHAALVGTDSLILLDEAHLSRPFVETLGWVRHYQQTPQWAEQTVGKPLTVVEMTATPPPGAIPFELTADDDADEVLVKRLKACKPAELIEVATDKDDRHIAIAALARELAGHGVRLMQDLRQSTAAPVVGVVANRVLTARMAHEALLGLEEADAILLTGRMRPIDRAFIEKSHHHRIRAGRAVGDNPRPLFVVSTQTIEVGADLDFDGLVTESAALDALRQRFGRLNRLGDRAWCCAVVVHDKQAPKDDPVYGEALVKTWKWIKSEAAKPRKAQHPLLDFGIRALEPRLPRGDELIPLLAPARPAPVLMPAHLDMLAQTSPAPAVSPDLALLLHGAGSQRADVQVVWRADLPEQLAQENEKMVLATLALLPPTSAEAMPLPISALRQLLGHVEMLGLTDVEGGMEAEDAPPRRHAPWVVRWQGGDKSSVGPLEDIRPGDTVVLPAAYGGLDRVAGSTPLPLDVGDATARQRRGVALMRFHPALVAGWFATDAAPEDISKARQRVREFLGRFTEAEDCDAAARDLASFLAGLPGLDQEVLTSLTSLAEVGEALPYPGEIAPEGVLLTEPRNVVRAFSDEDDSSSLTCEIGLQAHCDGVGHLADHYATTAGLAGPLVGDAALAGHFHDLGKADLRLQAWLRGGDRIAARRAPEPLAKSAMRAQDSIAREGARRLADYPRGARHECYSVVLLESQPDLLGQAKDAELVRYLVGTHHGRGRPFLPVVDDSGMSVSFTFDGRVLDWSGPHGLERLDSGWTDCFWRLIRRYGYWGLPWLETLVRLADHHQSAKEME